MLVDLVLFLIAGGDRISVWSGDDSPSLGTLSFTFNTPFTPC